MAKCPKELRIEIYRAFWKYLKEIKYNISITIFVHKYCDDHRLGHLYGRGATGDIDETARRCGLFWHRLCAQLVKNGDLIRVSRDCYTTLNQTGLDIWKKHEYERQSDIRYHFNLITKKWDTVGMEKLGEKIDS